MIKTALLIQHLETGWDLSSRNVLCVDGHPECFDIATDQGVYFANVATEENAETENGYLVQSYLKSQNFPVTASIPTTSGESWFRDSGPALFLEEMVFAVPFRPAPQDYYALGQLKALLHQIPNPTEPPDGYFALRTSYCQQYSRKAELIGEPRRSSL